MRQRTLLDSIRWNDLDMESVIANSYRDFHVKGFDYLCLHRSPELTVKVYFAENGMQNMSEVVNPHDHRYDFTTQCLSGVIRNRWFRTPPCWDTRRDDALECGHSYNVHRWYTPLLGGRGFEHVGRWRLEQHKHGDYLPGQSYSMFADELHTIQVMQPETCIVLAQYEDVVPQSVPTLTFTRSEDTPSIDGLYNTFTADQAQKRINLAKELLCGLRR